jgi:predicted transglutaminase-like cysteine proteinase
VGPHSVDILRARLIYIADAIGEPPRSPIPPVIEASQEPAAADKPTRVLGARAAAAVVGALSVVSWLAIAGIVAVIAACATQSSDPTLALLTEVNVEVNRTVRYIGEADGRNDWKVAESEGDCEDFALRKRRDLVRHGFPPLDLSVLTVPGHAMLLARTRDGAFVLDNRTDRIVAWDGTGREYLPLGSMWLPRDYVLKTVKGTPEALEVASSH